MRDIGVQPFPWFENEMDVGETIANRLRLKEAIFFIPGVPLLGHMLFPDNEHLRHQLFAAIEPVRQRLLEFSGRHDPRFFGGPASVELIAETAREHLFKPADTVTEKQWTRAARILRFVTDMAHDERSANLRGGASLNKAFLALADLAPRIQTASLRRAWDDFRDVAHLLAATEYLVECANESLAGDDIRAFNVDVLLFAPDLLLPLAYRFQEFGLSHRASTSKQTLLDPERLWRIPEPTGSNTVRLPTKPLTNEEMALVAGGSGSHGK